MKKLSARKIKAPSVRAPGFLGDLIRDLRDRRLLIPAIGLVLALVAVPTLLASSPESEPAPAPATAGASADSATSPAVLAEQVGVRDYRKRLEQLKSKNPFEQQFPLPDVASGDDADVVDAAPPVASGGGSADGSSFDSSGGSPVEPIGTDSAPGTGGNTGDSGGANPPRVETRYFTRRIDVLVGPTGSVETRRGVRQLALLPSNATPVVVFLGVSESGGKAVFGVSGDVSSTAGDGSCFPSADNCDYLVLSEGDERTFDYTPDGLTYRLKLQDIRRVVLKRPPDLEP